MSVALYLFDVIWTHVYLEWFCIIAKSIDIHPSHPISNLYSLEWVSDTNGDPRQKDEVIWKGDRAKVTQGFEPTPMKITELFYLHSLIVDCMYLPERCALDRSVIVSSYLPLSRIHTSRCCEKCRRYIHVTPVTNISKDNTTLFITITSVITPTV